MNRTEERAENGEKQPYLKRWKQLFTKIIEAAKLKGKVDNAKWSQSDSKSLDNLPQSKPNPNTIDIEYVKTVNVNCVLKNSTDFQFFLQGG